MFWVSSIIKSYLKITFSVEHDNGVKEPKPIIQINSIVEGNYFKYLQVLFQQY